MSKKISKLFRPQWTGYGGAIFGRDEGLSIEQIKNEPMLHSAGLAFAFTKGGYITRRVLEAMMSGTCIEKLLPNDKYIVIDSRVALLQPGQTSAIPGWHCDAVPRDPLTGQPDLTLEQDLNCRNWVYSFAIPYACPEDMEFESWDYCRTEIINKPVTIDVFPEDGRIWEQVHDAVEYLVPPPKMSHLMNDHIYSLSQHTLHRATPADEACWRFWLRAAWYPRPPKNEVRVNCNVYTTEGGGW